MADQAMSAVEASFAGMARDNGRLRAIVDQDVANARARAELVDTAQPLCGTTFAAKDMIDVAGLPTCCGSRLFAAVPAARDAACVAALQSAGAVVVGKSNMHELAVGSACNPWFGQVVNPLSAECGTGGTSSGSAAAVAAGFCDFALGTDSGGSNRSTAAATGLYGYKPTNGLLPMQGIRPLAPTLDTVGILARHSATLGAAFSAVSGQPVGHASLQGRVIAEPVNLHGPVDSPVDMALGLARDAIRQAGGRIVELAFPDPGALQQAGKSILRFEFLQTYGALIAARSDAVAPAVLAFAALARETTEAQYREAIELVEDQRRIWYGLMDHVDALLSPPVPGLAPRLSDEMTEVGGQLRPYGAAGAEFRMWANTIGLPAIAIPVPRPGGLPASVQLAARSGADSALIGLAAALGRALKGV
jgi:Asp-tRNA(Asn)/Glu-tRNA(Gln) amidotransferase A subunit family amidase